MQAEAALMLALAIPIPSPMARACCIVEAIASLQLLLKGCEGSLFSGFYSRFSLVFALVRDQILQGQANLKEWVVTLALPWPLQPGILDSAHGWSHARPLTGERHPQISVEAILFEALNSCVLSVVLISVLDRGKE